MTDNKNNTNKRSILMANLTQEQYEKLKPYEKHLINAYRSSYVHMSGADFVKVSKIYDEVFESPLTNKQKGCNTCRLNALRKLGELYVNYNKPEEEKEEEKKKTPRKKKLSEE